MRVLHVVLSSARTDAGWGYRACWTSEPHWHQRMTVESPYHSLLDSSGAWSLKLECSTLQQWRGPKEQACHPAEATSNRSIASWSEKKVPWSFFLTRNQHRMLRTRFISYLDNGTHKIMISQSCNHPISPVNVCFNTSIILDTRNNSPATAVTL